MIYHIYWGTSGNSGLYLDEIYQVLNSHNYKQRVFVNYYYPFNYGNKVFFHYGDVSHSNYKGVVRKFIQLIEILKGYLIILFYAIKEKPSLINYSHVGSSYFFISCFLKLVKKLSGARLLITCHDVLPHESFKREMKNRKNIFHTADYLLVHTDKSIEDLIGIFGMDSSKIVKHLFPIMDLSKIMKKSINPYPPIDFLFIGHLRKDKGIELLLDAWKDFNKINKGPKLRVCGRLLPDISFNKEELEKCNVEFNLGYINDDDYYNYIKSARYVILPYLQGTNSGIVSTVLSVGTQVITSDISMFKENPLICNDNMFKAGDKQALIKMLQSKWLQSDNFSNSLLAQYKDNFSQGVLSVYNTIYLKK